MISACLVRIATCADIPAASFRIDACSPPRRNTGASSKVGSAWSRLVELAALQTCGTNFAVTRYCPLRELVCGSNSTKRITLTIASILQLVEKAGRYQ